MKKIRLKKNLIIPAGTEFEDISGTTKYLQGVYESVISLSDDTCAYLVIYDDVLTEYGPGMFEEVVE